jgi:hypothetical protein
MQIKPKVKTQDILTCESGKELIIYDLTLDKAFLLNETNQPNFEPADKIRL